MKKFLLILLSATFLFTACSKKKNTDTSHGYISATINGQPFKINNCTVGQFASDTMTGLAIEGASADRTGRRISLAIANYTTGATGTYSTTTYPDISIRASVDTLNTGYGAKTGTITIKTSTDKEITGTFSFVCYDSMYVVTNGEFDAKR